MSNILVTGSTGFLGNALIGQLKNKDNIVVGMERDIHRKHKVLNNPDVVVRGDIKHVVSPVTFGERRTICVSAWTHRIRSFPDGENGIVDIPMFGEPENED